MATKVFTWVCGVHWALAENANRKAFRKKRYRLLRTGFFKESEFIIQIYPNKRFAAYVFALRALLVHADSGELPLGQTTGM